MEAQRPRRELPIEIVAEILRRLPPLEPAWLVRASVACKAWGGAISDPDFRRRLPELHGTPPVLGFLHNWDDETVPRFIRTTDSLFALAAPDCRSWRALDCRHGRALFLSRCPGPKELLLWKPITGSKQRVPVPAAFEEADALRRPPTAAVFCAADPCNHIDCHDEGPFRLVFVFSVKVDTNHQAYVTSARVYSSETDTWGEPTSVQGVFSMRFTDYSSVLAKKNSLLYFMADNLLILEYDIARHRLIVLDPPDQSGYVGRCNIGLSGDGGLGVCQYLYPKLKIWKRGSDDTDAEWVLNRVVYLDGLLPIGGVVNAESTVQVMGFAEEADVIFFNTNAGIFTVDLPHLQSRQVRNVWDNLGFCNLIPVASFYTPWPRGEHQDPSSSGPSEEGGEEEGEKETTVDQAQQLLDKGSNAIKEGGLVNAFECVSHNSDIRVPCYGEVAPECATMEDKHGHALPSESQDVIHPLGDIPNNSLTEELAKSTSATSKDDTGNSKTSGSNVEDAAPTLEKGDSEEGIVCHCPFPRNGGCARAELLCGDLHDFLKFASASRFHLNFYLDGIVSQTRGIS